MMRELLDVYHVLLLRAFGGAMIRLASVPEQPYNIAHEIVGRREGCDQHRDGADHLKSRQTPRSSPQLCSRLRPG